MSKQKHLLKLIMLASTLILSACSSDSDDPDDNPNDDNPLSGVFLDSAVEGLSFTTATQSGTTDSNGTYLYLDDETINFSLNGAVLGETSPSEVLTPMDLQDATKHSDYGLNIIRLLMTLDADGILDNGITIETDAVLDVDFDQSTESFTVDTDVINYISTNTTNTLVPVSDAISHFSTTQETIGATSSYTIDLAGLVANSVITTSDCGAAIQGGWRYTFSSTGYGVEGSDSFNNCSVVYTDPLDGYTQTFGQVEDDTPFDCASSVCTYADLNKTVEGIDQNGRNFYSTYFHTPGSRVFTYIKTIAAPSNEVYTEVITLHEDNYVEMPLAFTESELNGATFYPVWYSADNSADPACPNGGWTMDTQTYDGASVTITSCDGNSVEPYFVLSNGDLNYNNTDWGRRLAWDTQISAWKMCVTDDPNNINCTSNELAILFIDRSAAESYRDTMNAAL